MNDKGPEIDRFALNLLLFFKCAECALPRISDKERLVTDQSKQLFNTNERIEVKCKSEYKTRRTAVFITCKQSFQWTNFTSGCEKGKQIHIFF